MEFLTELFANKAVIAGSLASIISSISTLILIFLPKSKPGKVTEPVLKVLNTVAGNVGNNK